MHILHQKWRARSQDGYDLGLHLWLEWQRRVLGRLGRDKSFSPLWFVVLAGTAGAADDARCGSPWLLISKSGLQRKVRAKEGQACRGYDWGSQVARVGPPARGTKGRDGGTRPQAGRTASRSPSNREIASTKPAKQWSITNERPCFVQRCSKELKPYIVNTGCSLVTVIPNWSDQSTYDDARCLAVAKKIERLRLYVAELIEHDERDRRGWRRWSTPVINPFSSSK